MIGCSITEANNGFAEFIPAEVNALEARLYQHAVAATGKNHWYFNRFGLEASEGEAPDGIPPHPQENLRKASYREMLNAMTLSCKNAFAMLDRQQENRLRKARTGFVYFDAWGETGVIEGVNSWRDSMSIDMLPKALVKAYSASAFSCKVRGERSGFLQGLRIASDLLNSDAADTVILCGQVRALPVLVLSEAAAFGRAYTAKWYRHFGNQFCVERTGCMVLSKTPREGIALNLSHYFLRSENRAEAAEALSACWQQHMGDNSAAIYGATHPSAEVEAMEHEALKRLKREIDYLSISSLYGDSHCFNPMLAVMHLHSLSHSSAAHVLVNADDGQRGEWLLECWKPEAVPSVTPLSNLPKTAAMPDGLDKKEPQ